MGRFQRTAASNQSITSGVIPSGQGGTGATNVAAASSNLNFVSLEQINQPDGVLVSDEQNKIATARISTTGTLKPATLDQAGNIDPALVPPELSTVIGINGPTTLNATESATYTISNPDMATVYDVSALAGSVQWVDSKSFTYTAPTTQGSAGFTINDRVFAVEINPSAVIRPVISSPVHNQPRNSGTLIVQASDFAFVGQTDTHESSDWQISTDQNFSTLAFSSSPDTVNKVTWQPQGLVANTAYFLRVRYKGAVLGYSAWSDTIAFTTKDVTVAGPANVYVGSSNTYTISNYDSQIVYTLSAQNGTISRSGSIITYVTGNTPSGGGFTINGKSYAITINASIVVAPTITSPVDGAAGMSSSVTITSSEFAYGGTVDTQTGSSWELSDSPDMSNPVAVLTNSSIHLTSWVVDGLSPNTAYYVRVKHIGANNGSSEWSGVSGFQTKASFVASVEVATIQGSTGDFGMGMDISSNANVLAVGSPLDSTQVSNGGAVTVYTGDGTTMTQSQKIYPTSIQEGLSLTIPSGGSIRIQTTGVVSDSTYTTSANVTLAEGVTGITITGNGSDGDITPGDPATISFDRYGQQTITFPGGTTGVAPVTNVSLIPNTKDDNLGRFIRLTRDGKYLFALAATANNDLGQETGVVYVFENIANNYVFKQKIIPDFTGTSATRLNASFDISQDGTTLVLTTSDSKALVYTKDNTNTWLKTSVLSESTITTPYTATAISDDGKTVFLGSHTANSNAGEVCVFVLTGTTWSTQSKLTGTNSFGFSLATHGLGDTLIVGSGTISKPLKVFTRSALSWTSGPDITPPSAGSNASIFGRDIQFSDNGLSFIATADYDASGKRDAGHIYTGSGATWSLRSSVAPNENTNDLYYGQVARLTSDGAKAAISAPLANRVYLYA